MSDDFDMTMIIVTHHAFQRDLRYLTDATEKLNANGDPGRRDSVIAGWKMLRTLLQSHHEGEDKSMWPRMRAGLRDRPDDLAVLDAMEEEHHRIDPLMSAVDAGLRAGSADPDRLAGAVAEFTTEVSDHLKHEELDAFPLVKIGMTPAQWNKTVSEMRGGLAAMRAAPEFFPWLLDDASAEDRAAVLGLVPPPLRLIYQRIWQPRYAKQARW